MSPPLLKPDPHSTIDQPYRPTLGECDTQPRFRILRELSNQDGWIARQIPNNRVAYIRNLSSIILDLDPGQVWTGNIIKSLDRYDLITLDKLLIE